MKTCNICNQPMLTADSCISWPILGIEPLRFGDEKDIFDAEGRQIAFAPAFTERCRDCGVARGGYHHRGCVVERCPICADQAFCCGCLEMEYDLQKLTYKKFLKQYDREGAVILLEGKRDVPAELQPKLTALGEKLCRETKHIRFRSGNASGADEYFSKGVASVDAARLEVITPFNNHRRKSTTAQTTHSLDTIDLSGEPEIVRQTKLNKKSEKLIDAYARGVKTKLTLKAAYLLRDTVKVIGTQAGIKPMTFGIFYDDPEAPRQGGTGHTMHICAINRVPHIDQQVWLKWLKD